VENVDAVINQTNDKTQHLLNIPSWNYLECSNQTSKETL